MSSLRKEDDRGRTGWRLRFYVDKKRRSIYIADPSKHRAETIARHVDELVRANASNDRPDPATAKWATASEGPVRSALERCGLVDHRPSLPADAKRCGVFFESWVSDQTHLDPSTRTKYRQATTWWAKRFADERTLSSITPAEFESWHRWMINPDRLAEATANKHAKRIRTLFKEAIKSRLIADNPTVESKIGGEVNHDRDAYVSPADTTAILAECGTEWALIFGLCRFAGFRCPTEVTGLRWSDVQWDAGRLRIDSVKTGLRFCPIFPNLRPLLDAAREIAPVGADHVIGRHRDDESNLRTQFKRIIESAGVKPWPKLFVNLRASCRTDLEERFPSHVIDAWLGHSTKVARKHYTRVTDLHWSDAVANSILPVGGPIGGPISVNLDAPGQNAGIKKHRKNRGLLGGECFQSTPLVPPLGLEPRTHGLRVRCSTN